MTPTLTNIITTLAGQVVSFGLAAFFWQYIQKKLEKIDDVDRRVFRIENRDELRRELGVDKPQFSGRPSSEPDQPNRG